VKARRSLEHDEILVEGYIRAGGAEEESRSVITVKGIHSDIT
jgi:hypothetical protein